MRIYKFIDEAGDPNFFGKGKKYIVGSNGVSKSFLLGMVSIKDETSVKNKIKLYRDTIIRTARDIGNNPYYSSIPSVRKRKEKYGSFIFHAKDDVPEIRKECFDMLATFDFTFQAAVAVKNENIFIKKHNRKETEFYADILSHLISDKVHQDLVLNIAKRGKCTHDVNLEKAFNKAKKVYTKRNKNSNTSIPKLAYNVQDYDKEPILTIADYCSWSIQRIFERGETRFYNYLGDKIRYIEDIYSYNPHKKWIYRNGDTLTDQDKIGPSDG